MNKEKYLKELEKRLDKLNDEQKQNEIFRVSNELDSGKIMNDLSIEVSEIYKKYKINPNKKKKNSQSSNIVGIFYKHLKENDYKKNLLVLRDIILILLIVSVLKIPFITLENLVQVVFKEMIADKYYTIIHYIIEGIYILFAIYIFIVMFKRRFKKELELD